MAKFKNRSWLPQNEGLEGERNDTLVHETFPKITNKKKFNHSIQCGWTLNEKQYSRLGFSSSPSSMRRTAEKQALKKEAF